MLIMTASAQENPLEPRTVSGILAEISHAAQSAVEHLVSSVQNRVVPTARSLLRRLSYGSARYALVFGIFLLVLAFRLRGHRKLMLRPSH